MNRYIIFDMDGVVIDSEGWYLNLLRNFLSNNNFNIPDKVLMEAIGLDMIHVFKRIGSYISGNDIEKLIEKYLDYIKDVFMLHQASFIGFYKNKKYLDKCMLKQ